MDPGRCERADRARGEGRAGLNVDHIALGSSASRNRSPTRLIARIVQSGRAAGTLVKSANVERYTRMGVRAIMTSFFPWIQAGAKDLIDRAAAGAKG